MAGKKASELGDRFRRVATGERAPDAKASAGVPSLGMDVLPAPGNPLSAADARLATESSIGDGANLLSGTARKGGPGRKAKVGLRPGTGRHRFTLDLDGPQHRYLKQLALDAQTDMASVVRVLITSLEEDPALRNEVAMRARLRRWRVRDRVRDRALGRAEDGGGAQSAAREGNDAGCARCFRMRCSGTLLGHLLEPPRFAAPGLGRGGSA